MLRCKLWFFLTVAQQMLALDPGYTWLAGSGKKLPCSTPLLAGWGTVDDNIFIGRAWYKGNLLPAKVMPVYGRAFVGWNGKEFDNASYEVLCGSKVNWKFQSDGQLPTNAIPVGKTKKGDILYYGRAQFGSGLHPGKIYEGKRGLFIPYNGKEHVVYEYEVLVGKQKPTPPPKDDGLDALMEFELYSAT